LAAPTEYGMKEAPEVSSKKPRIRGGTSMVGQGHVMLLVMGLAISCSLQASYTTPLKGDCTASKRARLTLSTQMGGQRDGGRLTSMSLIR
jgi:hypothetical protein